MSAKSIVIVGGGGAGYGTARRLSAKLSSSSSSTGHSITLITARPFSIYLPAAARFTTTSEGHLEDTALLPYDKLFANGNDKVKGEVKIGRVIRIEHGGDEKSVSEGREGGEVVLESGERVRYDVLVLAPGSIWAGPLGFPDGEEEVRKHIESWRRKFEEAKGVVLVGGGAVGIGTHRSVSLHCSLPLAPFTGQFLVMMVQMAPQNTPARSRTSIQTRKSRSFTTVQCSSTTPIPQDFVAVWSKTYANEAWILSSTTE